MGPAGTDPNPNPSPSPNPSPNPDPDSDLLRWERQAALQGGIEEGSLREMAAAVVDMAERRRAAQGAAAVAAPAAVEPKQEPKQPGVFDGIRF